MIRRETAKGWDRCFIILRDILLISLMVQENTLTITIIPHGDVVRRPKRQVRCILFFSFTGLDQEVARINSLISSSCKILVTGSHLEVVWEM